MKKLILALAIGVVSTLSFADKPLPVQYGEPAPMGEPVVNAGKSKSGYSKNDVDLLGVSIFAGYSGQEAKPEYEDKQKLNGIELGASYSWSNFGVYEKYEHQSNNQVKYNELSTGIQYKFFKQNNVYLMGSAALGYGWGETKETKADLEFLTLPVGLELGYSITSNFDAYGGVGYKWLWDRSENSGCSMYACWSGRGDVVGDTDGLTYKTGLRYNF